MPFLPDEHSTDKLLKNLGIHLSEHFGRSDLESFGWFQFRNNDRPNTLVSTEFAAIAFLYLSFDADGSWRRNPTIITAVTGFMGMYYHVTPQGNDVMKLKQAIDMKPHNPQAITDWFYAMYPPEYASDYVE